MSDTALSVWVVVCEVVAAVGFLLVIGGVVVESVELVIKWGERKGFRQFIGKRVGATGERRLLSLVSFLSPIVLRVETLGFAILVLGLGTEFMASNAALFLQGKENARLIRRLDDTTEKAGIAIKEAETLRLEAVRAQKELALLKASVQWRDITDAQETNLIARLKPAIQGANPRPIVKVSAIGDNPEPRLFADRIVAVLLKCGFEVIRYQALNIGVKAGAGIEVDVRSLEAAPVHAVAILDAFKDFTISPVMVAADARMKDNVVEIWVLYRPQSPLR